MPKVATAVAADLAAIDPAHAAYSGQRRRVRPPAGRVDQAITSFKAKYPGTPVATTEPVADYLLQASGADNLTPFTFQADIMNGVDPSPQDVATEKALFTGHKVKVFLYNQQVTDSLTQSFIAAAQSAGVPVVGVYETMPTPGYDYQSWMLAEVNDLDQGRGQQDLDRAPVMPDACGPAAAHAVPDGRGSRGKHCCGWTGSASGSAAARSWTESRSPSGRVSSPGSSGRTARARPPCCASSSACRRPTSAGSCWKAGPGSGLPGG